MLGEKKRYIEHLRVLSMLAVVLIHICLAANSVFESTVLLWESVFVFCLARIFRFAVPIFFMISGALLLNPDKKISLKKLWNSYIKKYLLVIVFWGGDICVY